MLSALGLLGEKNLDVETIVLKKVCISYRVSRNARNDIILQISSTVLLPLHNFNALAPLVFVTIHAGIEGLKNSIFPFFLFITIS